MGAVDSTSWGTEGGQNLMHVLRKLAHDNRWGSTEKQDPPIPHPPQPSSASAPLYGHCFSFSERPYALIRIFCQRPRHTCVMRASLSCCLSQRLIQAYCLGYSWHPPSPPPCPLLKWKSYAFEVVQPCLCWKQVVICAALNYQYSVSTRHCSYEEWPTFQQVFK